MNLVVSRSNKETVVLLREVVQLGEEGSGAVLASSKGEQVLCHCQYAGTPLTSVHYESTTVQLIDFLLGWQPQERVQLIVLLLVTTLHGCFRRSTSGQV